MQWPHAHCSMLNSQGLRESGRVRRTQEWKPLWICWAVGWQQASAGTKRGPERTLKQTLFLSCALATLPLTAPLAPSLGSPCTEQDQTCARGKRRPDQGLLKWQLVKKPEGEGRKASVSQSLHGKMSTGPLGGIS